MFSTILPYIYNPVKLDQKKKRYISNHIVGDFVGYVRFLICFNKIKLLLKSYTYIPPFQSQAVALKIVDIL